VTQPEKRPRHGAGDEGAAQTAVIMAAVKALRKAKDWSAQQLADEMAKVGVPWNRHIVVNLEQGRRKSLRVHELLALAYVLDAETPLDLLVPYVGALFPVTPDVEAGTVDVERWFSGETGPLRQYMEAAPDVRNQAEHDRAVKKWRAALADAGMRGLIPVPALETEAARYPEDGSIKIALGLTQDRGNGTGGDDEPR
jgi:transcriptional regulator with XRE-family HTH domain